MTTNNYYAFGPFSCGGTFGEGLHIGRSAAGRRFLFRAQQSLGLTTMSDWLHFLGRDGVTIRNEYGRDVPLADIEAKMRQTDIEGRPLRLHFPSLVPGVARDGEDNYVDSDGHAFRRCDFC